MTYFADYSKVLSTAGRLNYVAGVSQTIVIAGKPRLPGLSTRGTAESHITIDGKPRLPGLGATIVAEEVTSKTVIGTIFDNHVSVTAGKFNTPIFPVSKLNYPKFGVSVEAFVPQKIHPSELIYPKYGFKAAGGQFPPTYTNINFSPVTTVNTTFTPDFAITDPDPFLFADWSYSAFTVNGELQQTDEVTGTLTYPVFGIYGVGGNIDVNGAYNYPQYETAFRLINTREVNATLQYPFFATDFNIDGRYNLTSSNIYPIFTVNSEAFHGYTSNGVLNYPVFGVAAEAAQAEYIAVDGLLTYPSMTVEAWSLYNNEFFGRPNYPVFEVNGDFSLPHHGYGDQKYPVFYTEGFVGPLGSMLIEVNYPVFAASGELWGRYSITSDNVYPSYAINAEAKTLKLVNAAWNYPLFGVASDINVPIGINGDNVYANYTVSIDVSAPIGTSGNINYPQLTVDGLIGINVKIDNSDLLFPLFMTDGLISYTASADLIIRYPKYEIAGVSANIPEVEGSLIYPVFGVAYQLENYYGADMNINVVKLTANFDADPLKSRRHVFVIER